MGRTLLYFKSSTTIILLLLSLNYYLCYSETDKTVGFVENKGQIVDQHGNLRPDVRFLYDNNGFKLHLKNNSFSYEMYIVQKKEVTLPPEFSISPKLADLYKWEHTIKSHRVDFELLNSNPDPAIIPEGISNDWSNYYKPYTPEEGINYIHYFQKVTYKNIYPFIDLVFYNNADRSNQSQNKSIKYDFVLHPGSNINDIKLMVFGSDKLYQDEKGSIIISTEYGVISENIPLSFQKTIGGQQENVQVDYNLTNNIIGFKIENLNENRVLVIDPVPALQWCTYFGGSLAESVTSTAMDGANLYIGGGTTSTSNIATSGAHQTSWVNNYDGYLAKFNSSGQLIWATYYGGDGFGLMSGEDHILDIELSGGNVYIVGQTYSDDNSNYAIATQGSFQPSAAGWNEGMFVKFNSNGVRQWGTYIGGSSNENLEGIGSDGSGNIYIGGYTQSQQNISTSGAYQEEKNSVSGDSFIMKFNSAGERLWGTYIGTDGEEWPFELYSTSSGSIYLCGRTSSSSGFATSGAHQTSYAGSTYDGFLLKFNSSGQRQWITYYGGSGYDVANYISEDRSGNIYLGGYSNSSSGIASSGSFQSSLAGGYDAFIAKFNSSGVRQWATYLGGSGSDYGSEAYFDSNNNGYFSGQTGSSNNIATSGAYDESSNGDFDNYIVKFNSSGERQWGSYFGASGADKSSGFVKFDNQDNMYIAGVTNSSGLGTSGVHQENRSGDYDAFIAKFDPNPPMVTIESFSSSFCTGESYSLPYTVSKSFQSGNTFTAQLSDKTGNFTSPTDIGSITSTNSGSINLTIPISSEPGTAYSIRIKSTSPQMFSSNTLTGLTIETKPSAEITGNISSCKGSLETYSSNDNTVTNNWYVTNGSISGQSNLKDVDILWSNTGNGRVKLVQTTSGDCKDSTEITITVNPLPIVQITGDNDICMGESATYTAGPSSGVTHAWYALQNGAIIGSNTGSSVEINWTAGGTGKVKLVETITATGCQDSTVYDVNISAPPKVEILGSNYICPNIAIRYRAKDTDNSDFKWIVTGGTILGSDTKSEIEVVWEEGTKKGIVKLVQSSLANACKDSTEESVWAYNHPHPEIDGKLTVKAESVEPYTALFVEDMVYLWEASGGTIQGANNLNDVNVKWGIAGSGKLKLIETTKDACTDSVEISVSISDMDISITGNNSACENSQHIYTADIINNRTTKWRAIGGTIAGPDDTETVNVNWSSAGNGIIRLIQTDTGTMMTDSADLTVTINPQPDPVINGMNPAQKGSSQKYSVTQNPGSQYLWSAEGGTIDGPNNTYEININWGGGDIGKLSVKETSKDGCIDSSNISITLSKSGIIISGDNLGATDNVCEGSEETYRTTAESGKEYLWETAGGAIAGNNNNAVINVIWGSAGNGKLKLTVTTIATNYKDSIEKSLIINSLPEPKISGPALVPKGTSQDYTADTPAGTDNLWSVSGGEIAGDNTGNSITVNWGTPGNGSIKLVQINSSACTDSTESVVEISNSSILLTGNNSVCEAGQSTYSTQYDSDKEYLWNVTGGSILGENTKNSIEVLWGSSGIGEVKLNQEIVSTQFVDSVSMNVTINPLPVVALSDLSPVCLNAGNIILSGGSPAGGTYSGNFVNNNTFDPQAAGIGKHLIDYTYINKNLCQNTASKQIEVLPIPDKPSIIYAGGVLISSSATGNQWYLDNVEIAGANEQTYEPTEPGNYTLMVRSANGCLSDVSDPYIFDVNLPHIELSIGKDTLRGIPGQEIVLPIILVDSKNLSGSDITGFTATLTVNANLLYPKSGTPTGRLDGNKRIIDLNLPILAGNDGVVQNLIFDAMLGDDTISVLKLDNISGIGNELTANVNDGYFILEGICREGGARLVTSNSNNLNLDVNPNPAGEAMEINYEIYESGNIELSLNSVIGIQALTVKQGYMPSGKHAETCNLKNISSGTYFLILRTPTKLITKRVDIHK